MIEVRIRKETEPTTHAVRLCEIPAEDIEALIDSILEWGLFFDGGDGSQVDVSGQYVYYNAAAYFEVIISENPSQESEPAPDDQS